MAIAPPGFPSHHFKGCCTSTTGALMVSGGWRGLCWSHPCSAHLPLPGVCTRSDEITQGPAWVLIFAKAGEF